VNWAVQEKRSEQRHSVQADGKGRAATLYIPLPQIRESPIVWINNRGTRVCNGGRGQTRDQRLRPPAKRGTLPAHCVGQKAGIHRLGEWMDDRPSVSCPFN